MEKVKYLAFAFMAAIAISCSDTVTERVTYMINEPVFMSKKEFRASVKVKTVPQKVKEQGKICFYEGYLYISEPEAGIHIIDNRNPSRPQSVGFIELLGNVDLAIRNSTLYADSYVDLVWFDISNPAKPELVNRLEDVFSYALPVCGNEFGYDYEKCYYSPEAANGVVVGWKTVQRSEAVTHYGGGELAYNDSYYAGLPSSGGAKSTGGVNGSMSRFGLYGDYMYTVMNNFLSIFDLSGAKPAKAAEDVYVGWDVETIFPYKDCLFMGTPVGMTIYSVSNPLAPERMSTISHVYGCDPVVVENDIAYVTIHAGNFCGQSTNELIVYDVSDVKSPRHIVSYNMTNPKGLGIDRGTLFLCDDGLKIYKTGDDPQQLMANRVAHYAGMDGYDVIPYNNVLMMIAGDGLYQYDYSDPAKINALSKLAIGK
jgi:hypothetical protein